MRFKQIKQGPFTVFINVSKKDGRFSIDLPDPIKQVLGREHAIHDTTAAGVEGQFRQIVRGFTSAATTERKIIAILVDGCLPNGRRSVFTDDKTTLRLLAGVFIERKVVTGSSTQLTYGDVYTGLHAKNPIPWRYQLREETLQWSGEHDAITIIPHTGEAEAWLVDLIYKLQDIIAALAFITTSPETLTQAQTAGALLLGPATGKETDS